MKKEEVELVILKVSVDGQDAINMKIYKNGTTCRNGAGGLPQLGIGVMSFVEDSRYFDPLIEKVPQAILDQPISKEEAQTPNGALEYIIAFYGDSKNGETGEQAAWSKSTGVRIKLDQETSFNHPIMGFLDGLTMDAAELTNELYFDAIMNSKWKVKSSTLPEQTIITQPRTEEEINRDYENYVNQMQQSARQWKLSDYILGKTYEKEGIAYDAVIKNNAASFSISFIPKGTGNVNPSETESETTKKKPWWKFGK